MLSLAFKPPGTGLKLLLLGAHSDDIEIGCGGTILRLAQEYPQMEVLWIVFSAMGERITEAKNSAAYFLQHVSSAEIVVMNFQDSYFPQTMSDIKKSFEDIKRKYQPDVIFTHYRHDLHQDHKLISELTWNTFRDHLILEYEIPKYDGDLGAPNFFVPLQEEKASAKAAALMKYFPTQATKHWFDTETFMALMRIRGLESASATRYAEAFHVKKLVI